MGKRKKSPADALAGWLAKSKTTRESLAQALGVTETTVYHWLAGRRQVSVSNALRIQKLSNGALTLDVLCPEFE